MSQIGFKTSLGECLVADSLSAIKELPDDSINLVLTSPPFSNQRKKKYDSFDEIPQDQYVDWLLQWGEAIKPKLKQDGSIVIDIRSAYEKGHPVESLYSYEFLLRMCKELGYVLCQNVMWNNRSALPLPIEYVNKRPIRLKNSLNHNLWFSKDPDGNVKANNKNVLVPYSTRMQDLIDHPEHFIKGDSVTRPSGNVMSIGSWQKDNGGAKPSNLLDYPNTDATSNYLRYCKQLGVKAHPARYTRALTDFWIKFLTDEGDLVLDPFGGSGVTAMSAEQLGRRWLSYDISKEYVATSSFRFCDNLHKAENIYKDIMERDLMVEI